MSKGLGIAALVIGILSIIIPVISLYVVWLALILATITALAGDKTFSIATFAICLVNVLFLSPMTWLALKGEELAGGSFLSVGTFILFLAPIVGLVFTIVRRKKPLIIADDK
jgi:hypothetical protein